ncbi:MAG: hypothetical protein K2Y18_00605 [Alphaproteobacteria bacterium]|nr:hypothetical protein [Alphaproteobacteria bacterium]
MKIKPSKRNVKSFLGNLRELIKSNATATTENLIHQLNPKIRGWANYFCHVVAKDTFSYVDHHTFMVIKQWAKRRHPKKAAEWRRRKYFRSHGLRHWIFSVSVKNEKGERAFLDLLTTAQTPIRRHVKIRAEATPYDPQFKKYFLERSRSKRKTPEQDQREPHSSSNDSTITKRTTG